MGSPPAIDSDTWYNLVYGSASTQSFAMAYDINESGTGAIVGQALNFSSNPNVFQWQFLPIGPSDTYVVRSRYLGNQWMMGVFWDPVTTLPGMDTRIRTENFKSPDLAGTTLQWIVETTNDGTGTYHLSTVANTTSWHLESYQGIGYLREANTASSTNGMKWALSSVGAINDAQWSYTATSTASPTSTGSPTSSGPASNSATTTAAVTSQGNVVTSSNGNSSPLGAIVGGVIGGIAALLILFGIIFFLRRRKRQQMQAVAQTDDASPGKTFAQNSYQSSQYPQHSYPSHMSSELEGQQMFSPRFGTVAHSKPGIYEKASYAPVPMKSPTSDVRNGFVTELPGDSAPRRY